MAVEESCAVLAQTGDHGGPDRDIRHEVPVHHVHVQPVGFGVDLLDAPTEFTEVRREDRRRNADLARGTRVDDRHAAQPRTTIAGPEPVAVPPTRNEPPSWRGLRDARTPRRATRPAAPGGPPRVLPRPNPALILR